MRDCTFFYLSDSFFLGPEGPVANWAENKGLPAIDRMRKVIQEAPLNHGQAGLLIKDDLLHPLRVDLEEKVPAKERSQYLLWKLKRFLPYPVDQVSLRYLPLAEENNYLTFSLPTAWTQAVHEAFKARGVHCGYMSGLFASLLENLTAMRGQTVIGFFEDCYLAASLDRNGTYQEMRTRRLPLLQDGNLDTQTLINADLAFLQQRTEPISILCFAPAYDQAVQDLCTALEVPSFPGGTASPSALDRFHQAMQIKAVGP